MRDQHASMIMQAPEQSLHAQLNTTLVSLELNSNSIDYNGATALAAAISENNSLTSLYLRCGPNQCLRPVVC